MAERGAEMRQKLLQTRTLKFSLLYTELQSVEFQFGKRQFVKKREEIFSPDLISVIFSPTSD